MMGRRDKSAYSDVEMPLSSGGMGGVNIPGAIRLGFIRKVYGILSIQLLASTLMCALFMFNESLQSFVINSKGVQMSAMILSFVTLFALIALRDSYPTNMYLLAVWTVAMAYGVGVVCAAYQAAGAGMIVFQAFLLTAVVFTTLTCYAFYTKKDFSFMGAGLYSVLSIMIWASIFNMLFHFGDNFGFMYACGGAIVFSLYILYDTSLILLKLGPDDYILGAINLYLDILNLFLHILRALSKRD